MLPATSSRVFATCAISVANSNVMSTPAFGRPNSAPFRCETSGRCTLPSRHASPSSSGVTATGEKPLAGFDCRKPKPFASSAGIRLRRLTSLTSISRRTCASAAGVAVPIGTSPVTTATSASKSMPQASSASTMSSQRAEHVVGGALVHQRVGPELGRHRRAARARARARRGSRRPSRPPTGRRAAAAPSACSASNGLGVGQPARVELGGDRGERGRDARSSRRARACSVRAISGTATQRARSRDTTTSRPSRVPFRWRASCDASSRDGVSLAAPLQRIAVGAVLHLPAGRLQLARAAGPLRPSSSPCARRSGPRRSASTVRGHVVRLRRPRREPEAEHLVEARAASRASPPARGRRAAPPTRRASARGRLRSSLISSVNRSTQRRVGRRRRASGSAWKPWRMRSSPVAAASSASHVKLSWLR